MELALTQEQKLFIDKALEGKNILVDACIGSGKTTSIQYLCQQYPRSTTILYLTFNKLLKVDAKSRIIGKNITVTNYHGFAFSALRRAGIASGITDLIQSFIKEKPEFPHYDVLIIDEYQDIDLELSQLLEIIKASNSSMQLIAVGDMEQKIYDKTTLDIRSFIDQFLGNHLRLDFTQCFRLNSELAAKLGRIWNKRIFGVNESCRVEEMNVREVIDYLASQHPEDILCLGSRTGDMTYVLNELETGYPEIFNKKTVFASIADYDDGKAVEPKRNSAIFTTYDSSKGLERRTCIIFDFVDSYWNVRSNKPQQSYEILRNVFCVAASRGKEHVIFVKDDEDILSEEILSMPFDNEKETTDVSFSEMFDFKYKESVERCFSLLQINKIPVADNTIINVKTHDELIDLSPCIGIYQEASFFDKFNIDNSIDLYFKIHKEKSLLYSESIKQSTVDKKILFLTAMETGQMRYTTQVALPYITVDETTLLHSRLSTVFEKSDHSQILCIKEFSGVPGRSFTAYGFADVVKDKTVYELKFVSELSHENYLQCACYMIALNLKKGILWNTRKNEMYEIRIPDEEAFSREVSKTVLKIPNNTTETANQKPLNKKPDSSANNSAPVDNTPSIKAHDCFAVIDTETTFSDRVMSIGLCVVEKETYKHLEDKYYIITPEAYEPSMYADALRKNKKPAPRECSRTMALAEIKQVLTKYAITDVFAYNASFDKSHLPEMNYVSWYDIMRIAAYRQFNPFIPDDAECFKTGKLKRNYGVESMIRMISGNTRYCEYHNAVMDAIDESNLMKMLGLPYALYIRNASLNTPSFESSSNKTPDSNYHRKDDSTQSTYRINYSDRASAPKIKIDPGKLGANQSTYHIRFIDNDSSQKTRIDTSNSNHQTSFQSENQTGTSTKRAFTEASLNEDKTCSDSEGYFIDAETAANLLEVSKSTVYNLIKNGSIQATKKGNKYHISRQSVYDYIEAQRIKKRNAMLFAFVMLGLLAIFLLWWFISSSM